MCAKAMVCVCVCVLSPLALGWVGAKCIVELDDASVSLSLSLLRENRHAFYSILGGQDEIHWNLLNRN